MAARIPDESLGVLVGWIFFFLMKTQQVTSGISFQADGAPSASRLLLLAQKLLKYYKSLFLPDKQSHNRVRDLMPQSKIFNWMWKDLNWEKIPRAVKELVTQNRYLNRTLTREGACPIKQYRSVFYGPIKRSLIILVTNFSLIVFLYIYEALP